MRILVTGSAGYVGSNLVPRLKAEGHVVVGVDRKPSTYPDLDVFVQGDLAEAEVRAAVLEGVELIIHLAAAKDDWGIADETFFFENVEVTRRLIQDARQRGIHRWIFYSSVAVFGPSAAPIDEQAEPAPAIAYGASKVEGEALFRQYAAEEPSMSCMILRPSAIYGPGNYSYTNIYRLIEAVRTNRFIMIGDGSTMKTVSYIHNTVAATLFLMEHMTPGVHPYIYVDQPVYSTAALVENIYRLLGKTGPRLRLPLAVAKPLAFGFDLAARFTGINFPITAARIQKFCTSTHFDASAIRRLGFAQPFDNEEALRLTVEWHLATVAADAAQARVPG